MLGFWMLGVLGRRTIKANGVLGRADKATGTRAAAVLTSAPAASPPTTCRSSPTSTLYSAPRYPAACSRSRACTPSIGAPLGSHSLRIFATDV